MLRSFFGRRAKTFACGSTLITVGTCFFTNSLSTAAINAQTRQEGFVMGKTFGYLKNRVDSKDVEAIEKNWNWDENNVSNFLEKSNIFFDATSGDKTRLEKWLTLFKFSENNPNKECALNLKNKVLELIDMNSGELLAEYFDTKSIEDLLEIRKLDLLYRKTINEDKGKRYQKLLTFTEILKDRIAEYCSAFSSFCGFKEEKDEKSLSKKLSLARALTECFCCVFNFRTGDKDAFMCYKQVMHMVSYSSKVLSFNLSKEFQDNFVKDLLVAVSPAVSNLKDSKTAVKILSSLMFAYNKASIEGLKKMLDFWIGKNENDFLNELIKKEVGKKEINENGLKVLFGEADSLV